jgi:hypothetical protein
VLLGWFCDQLWTHGVWLGVAERILLVAQTIWPITVAVAVRPRAVLPKPVTVAEGVVVP